MKAQRMLINLMTLSVLLFMMAGLTQAEEPELQGTNAPQTLLGTGFTYQGRLLQGGNPISDSCDLQFGLWDAASGGTQLGVTQTIPGLAVSGGGLTALLNDTGQFGANAFNGEARYLAIAVKCGAESAYTPLTPRQALSGAPYALCALSTEALRGYPVASSAPAANQVLKWNGSAWAPAADADTTYSAGAGLALGGTQFSVAFGGSGSATAVAHSDHAHDATAINSGTLSTDRYSAYADLGAEGYLNNTPGGLAQNNGTIQATLNADQLDGQHAAAFAGVTHAHWGETWNGGTQGSDNGLVLEGTRYWSLSIIKAINHANGPAIWGQNTVGQGLRGDNYASGAGVWGGSYDGPGVAGYSAYTGNGVEGETEAADKSGVYGLCNSTGYGVYGRSDSGRGVYGYSGSAHAGYFDSYGALPTVEFNQFGTGRVLDLQNQGDANGVGGNDFITGFNSNASDVQFRITSSGQGLSDVGWTGGGADYAEMLPAVDGLEPGDVLVIGDDSILARSTVPYQPSVAGVYSTEPGFVGGHPVEGAVAGTIPLAMLGVVPVKVSAENGPIRPGDLLVSATIPGHAMRAGPNPPIGTVLGKALGRLDTGRGVLRALITLQ